MHAVFVAEQYYPEGGASDLFCVVPNGTPEEIRDAILRFYSYKLQDVGPPSSVMLASEEQPYDIYVVSTLDLQTMAQQANLVKLIHGGRVIRRKDHIYANEYSEHRHEKFIPELDQGIFTEWSPPPEVDYD